MGEQCEICHYIQPDGPSGSASACPKCGTRYRVTQKPATATTAPRRKFGILPPLPAARRPLSSSGIVLAIVVWTALIATVIAAVNISALLAAIYFVTFTVALAGFAIVNELRQ